MLPSVPKYQRREWECVEFCLQAPPTRLANRDCLMTVRISMTQTIIWQQWNTIKIIEIIHQDHSMQHNYIKTTSNGRMIPHTLVLQAENCKNVIGEYEQPVIDQRDCLRATPVHSLSHTRTGAEGLIC